MALVQKNAGTANGSASLVTSLGSATTAGNTILIFANGAGTITTPSGFTSRSPQVNIQGLYLFEKLVASGNSSDTPTLTMSGAYNATWQIVEYSGITAFDVSSGNNSNAAGLSSWNTPSITPTTGARLLVAFIAASNNSNSGTFSAGDPQLWINSFTSQQSTTRTGTTGSGRDSMVGGWADRSGVTGNGSTTYSTGADITSSTGVCAPASIIASYKVSSGNTYTLTASGGSYAVTGTAATLRRARLLGAAGGSYALTGTAAILRRGVKLASDAGSYALTGTAATFRRTRVLPAASGSYALTGSTASLRRGLVVAATAGAYAITGTAATLRHGYAVGAASGSYSLSGSTATLRKTWLLSAAAGSYAITGTAATLTKVAAYKLAANAGSYTVSGSTASLIVARRLSAAAGSYGLTGTAATLVKLTNGVLSAGTGSYALSGQAATLRAARKLAAGTSSYAISGQSATLRLAKKLSAVAGSYAVTGNTATLTKSGLTTYTLTAEPGSYYLSGQPATLTYLPIPGVRNPLERLKMYTGSMGSVSNREDWIVNISLVGDDGTSFDLTGAEIVAYVCKEGCANSHVLSASLGSGIVLTDDYTMQWHFSEEQMASLCPQQYDVFCRVERDDITTQLLAANVAIVEGGPA